MQSSQSKLAPAVSLAVGLISFFIGGSMAIGAAAPTNDVCSGATSIPGSGPFPYLSPTIADMRSATVAENLQPSCAIGVTNGVWYRFTPTVGGLYTFSTGTDTATTLFDPVMAIYNGSSCGGEFLEFACNDDAGGPNNRAAITEVLGAGATYYILVWIGSAEDLTDTNRTFALQLRVSRPVVPVNDSCAGAVTIGTTFPSNTSATDTTLATELDDEISVCSTGFRGVWYRFVPPTTDIYIFSTGSDTLTTVDDTALAIYQNSGGCDGTFTEVACSANGVGRAITSTTLTNGVTYYILVWDESEEVVPGETLVQLRVSKATAPSIVTLGASSIASTGAVLTASINPNGVLSRYWFEWGPTLAYGNTSAVRLVGIPSSTLTVTVTNSVTIGGYAATNTPVHYRAVATNSVGRSNGLDRTFVWSNSPPTVAGSRSLAGGNYRLSFTGHPGQLYAVETSTNLISWSYVGSAQELAPGQFQFTQQGAAALPRGFFRVKMP